MSLLPDSASFHERVQDLFAAYRGKGLSLSALDVELVDQWEATGAPFEVVARGMRNAAEAVLFDAAEGEGGLRSLRACRAKVEAELKKYLKASAGQHEAADEAPEPLHLARFKKLKSLLKKTAKENADHAAAIARIAPRLPEPTDYQHAEWVEHLAMALLTRALPWSLRHQLLREGRALVEKADSLSTGARAASRRFHREALVRRALSMKSAW